MVILMIKGKLTLQYNTSTEKYSVYVKTEIQPPKYMGFITKRNNYEGKWFICCPVRYLPDTNSFEEAKELFVTTILELLGSTKVSELVSDDGNNWSITYE